MKTLFRFAVPLLATLAAGCVNSGPHLAGLYGFDYTVGAAEVPGTKAMDSHVIDSRLACRPVLTTSREASPLSDPSDVAVDPFLAE